MNTIMTRDAFRTAVFERDGHKCVICGEPAKDAHHILERRLFPDGGYYLENGASLCFKHHIEAEMTVIDCETVRKAAKITQKCLPEHFYTDVEYDKWGNEVLQNGQRVRGELFFDPSVQKILTSVMDLFTDRVKYPRTFHLSFSPGLNRDDRMMQNEDVFVGQEVMICEKLDGENTTLYPDYMHARSINSDNHPSRAWVKNLWAQKGYNIPAGWRVCGENMFAKHAIHYTKEKGNALDTYFYMFSIWDERNVCLSWKDTEEWAYLLGFTLVPVLYKGIWDMKVIEDLNKFMVAHPDTIEGYVVRLSREYHYSEFKNVCGKYVRKGHVDNNHGHWAQQKITRNELKDK
jgi:hypothetical protein